MAYESLSERAMYQLACCYRGLSREGISSCRVSNRARAIAAFTRCMKRFPTGAVSHRAARAIADMNGGKLTAEAGAVYARVIRRDEMEVKKARIRLSSCGPMALRWLLVRQSATKAISMVTRTWNGHEREVPSIARLTTECRTGEGGTSIDDLIRVSARYGLKLKAFEVNESGLKTVILPAVLLWNRHYHIIYAMDERGVALLDPAGIPHVNVVSDENYKEAITHYSFNQIFNDGRTLLVVAIDPHPSESSDDPKEHRE